MAQIFKATYSGVPVYEITCNGVAVMRRKNDSYMNATQILKVADFDKPQRTRILEREVQTGNHEKIQGGYGKYQGTWVPLERAAALAKQYNVDGLIEPLLTYVKGAESPPLAPKHVTAASTKQKKPREKRTRKRNKVLNDDSHVSDTNESLKNEQTNNNNNDTQTQSPRRQPRKTASDNNNSNNNTTTVENHDNNDDIGMNQGQLSKSTRHSRHKRSKLSNMQDYMDIDKVDLNRLNTTTTTKSRQNKDDHHHQTTNQNNTNVNNNNNNNINNNKSKNTSSTTTNNTNLPSSTTSSPPSSPPSSSDVTKNRTKKEIEHERKYAQKLLNHFVSENDDIPSLLQRPPKDLDVNVIIDEEGHTSLHWAAVMGHIPTVQRLIKLGADMYRVNYKGQTALMRSVLYTNNYDRKMFDQLLDLLSSTIFNIDKCDQTVFHHVATTAKGKGKVHASKYYMENLIDKLMHNRSELISILNVQDVYGDTALTIASRIGNKKLIKLLIDAGASTEIANEMGMTSQDYLNALEHGEDLNQLSSLHQQKYTSERTTREKLRQKVDTMYKSMLSGHITTPTISHWVDDFVGSYERDLTQRDHYIKEKQRDIQLTINRLEETNVAIHHTITDQQEIKDIIDQGDRLLLDFKRLLLYTQRIRLEYGVKVKEKEEEEGERKKDGNDQHNKDKNNIKNEDVNMEELSKESTTIASNSNDVNNTTETPINKPPTPPIANNQLPNNENENEKKDGNSDQQSMEQQKDLQNQLDELKATRKQLFKDIIDLKSSIPEKRIQNYKRLISMCCNVTYENVDSMLSPLLASFDEAGSINDVSSTTS
ncbi:hypothetical protein BJ944DRAFT_239253 [Cunninghamella echinulata]|nr:hypothetical protein BJ944DRAFT_239253 [Cunninghamella echinulata]